MNPQELAAFCTKLVEHLVNDSPENHLHLFEEKAWGPPLIGIAGGDDPLFAEFKQIIGEVHWTPAEAFACVYPEETVRPQQLRVISWILPQTGATLADQRLETRLPAKRWICSRHFGELFNEWLRQRVCDELMAMGYRAVVPVKIDGWDYRQTPQAGICSNWSERHAAYVAGLGTFGLSDGFISEAGKAVRIGSVIVEADIETSLRRATSHTANCMYYDRGSCGACITRCPAKAITMNGHDKVACHNYIRSVTAPYSKQVSGWDVTPCGLCQARVPCERRNPLKSGSK